MRGIIPIGLSLVILLVSASAQALLRPQAVEIDGQKLEQKDAMDLLLNRGDQFVIADFKTIKVNGIEIQPYVMRSGEAIFVRTMWSDGDSTSWESKLRSPFKFAIICNAKAAAPPAGVETKSGVFLTSGQAAFAWLLEGDKDAQPYIVNGQTKMVYICDPKSNLHNDSQSERSQNKSSAGSTVR